MINRNISAAIDHCARAVLNSDSHDLPLGARQWIWTCLGIKDRIRGIASVGHYRRYRLARCSVGKIIPIWLTKYPDAKLIEDMIASSQKIMERAISLDEGIRQFEKYQFLEGSLPTPKGDYAHARANAVALVASRLVFTAIYDEEFDEESINVSLSNRTLDGFTYDVALGACCVYANGAEGNRDSDPMRRREFWLWWLKEAASTNELQLTAMAQIPASPLAKSQRDHEQIEAQQSTFDLKSEPHEPTIAPVVPKKNKR